MSFSSLGAAAAAAVVSVGLAGLPPANASDAAAGQSFPRAAPVPLSVAANSVFNAVDAVSTSDVWAAGYAVTRQGNQKTLVAHYDGQAWTRVPSPSPDSHTNVLNAISGVSADDVWAGGSTAATGRSLMEHWDGTRWTVSPMPSMGPVTGVVAISATEAWAVGPGHSGQPPLVERWDGTHWRVVPEHHQTWASRELQSISGTGSSDLWMVGGGMRHEEGNPRTLIEHGDGKHWVIPSNLEGRAQDRFNSVSAQSARDVWAGGNVLDGESLFFHFNGKAWHQVQAPNLGDISSVSADGPFDAWAVSTSVRVCHWNGTAWTMVHSVPSGHLTGVSAVTPQDVWIVGSTSKGSVDKGLVEHWDGTTWTRFNL